MDQFFNIPHLIIAYGYLGIFIIVFLESGIFFPLPGDSLIFMAGLLAPALGFNIIFLTVLVFLAAFLGGLAGYYIGTKLDFFYRYEFFRKTIKQEYLETARVFFEKHGLSAFLLSRFMPVVRTFLPIVAGMVRMNYYDFIRYNLLGALVWSATFTLGGYFLGRTFPQIESYLLYVVIAIVFISISPAIFHWFKYRK